MLLSFFTPLVTSIRTSSAQFGEIITGYYSPCRYGTEGTVTTWHGQNRDGQPPYDPTRRTYDFRCQDKTIHAPHEGVVWGVTPRFGGVILIDDRANEVCMVFLGMHGFGVEPNQTVRTGTYLGFYGHAFHLSAVDGYCADANWYDVAARERERPVIWEEFGEVLRPDIQKTEPVLFISQNPGGGPAFYLSILDNVGFEMK
jgi:hypothetical protein